MSAPRARSSTKVRATHRLSGARPGDAAARRLGARGGSAEGVGRARTPYRRGAQGTRRTRRTPGSRTKDPARCRGRAQTACKPPRRRAIASRRETKRGCATSRRLHRSSRSSPNGKMSAANKTNWPPWANMASARPAPALLGGGHYRKVIDELERQADEIAVAPVNIIRTVRSSYDPRRWTWSS